MGQQGQQLTDDELVKKYSGGSATATATPASTSGLSEDELVKKYGPQSTPPKPTTADNEVERNAPPANLGFTGSNIWKNVKSAANSAADFGKDVLFPQGNTEADKWKYLGNKYVVQPHDAAIKKGVDSLNAGHPVEAFGHAFASEVPLVGPFAESLGEQIGKGDLGGAATQAGAAYLGGKLVKGAGELGADTLAKGAPVLGKAAGRVAGGEAPLTVVRTTVGDALHDPTTGELKKVPEAAARVGGGLLGAKLGVASGIPEGGYGGLYLGGKYGPSLLEGAFPESTSRVAGRVTPYGPPNLGPTPEPSLVSDKPFTLTPPSEAREAPVQPSLFPKPGLEIPKGNPTPFGNAEPTLTPKPLAGKDLKPITDIIDKQSGVPEPETDPLKVKYPNAAIRQMVRANGEGIVNAIGDDKATMKAVHDLKNADVGVAAAKLGFNIGQRLVSTAQQYGSDAIPRTVVLDELIKAGHSPQEILEAAKPTKK